MKYSDLIGGISVLFIGLLFSIWSTSYQIGSLIKPGPGFLPLILGLLLILFSIILLLDWVKKFFLNKQKMQPFSLPGGWKKTAYTLLISLFAAFLFEKIGYFLTVFLLIVSLMLEGEIRSWKKMVLLSFLTALGVYLVFVLLLKQPLPRGPLGI